VGDIDLDPKLPLTLRLPVRGTYAPPEFMELSGMDRVRRSIERTGGGAPIRRFTGLRMTDGGLGRVTASMPASPWWQSGAGVFPAGVIAFVADMPASGAVLTSAPSGVGITTSQLALNFLRPATIRCQSIIGRAHLIHSTRSLGLSEIFVEDGRGRLLAHGTSRCVLFPLEGRAHREPPVFEDDPTDGPDPHLLPLEGAPRDQQYFETHSGIDSLREGMRSGPLAPLGWFLGMHPVEVGDGTASIAMPASAWLTSGIGTIYGGAIALLAEWAVTCAVASTIPAATAFSPLDLKVNFVRPAFAGDGELVARAKVVHRGRSIAIAQCEVFGPDGKQVAISNESVLILPGRPWGEKPVNVADEVQASEEMTATE
jgi:uncharacterized protein (TIGR00369 family)